jgi:thiol-disulfide isomerase/thioredoxin
MDTIEALTKPDKGRESVQSSAFRRVIRQQRYIANIVLACVAVGLEVYYSICGGSCSYLRGDLIGIPLQYIGIAYVACIIILSILRADKLLEMFISAGVGIEVYLIGFQVWYHTYCPYCLAFAAIIFGLFALNFTFSRKFLSIACMALALLLFSLFFEGSLTPSYAGDTAIPTFGQGKINVRLYTDYFCPPCRAMGPEVEPILEDLIKQKKINVTFIDTPYYQYSSLYAKYFLYAINEKRDFEYALKARGVLIEMAKQNIGDSSRIEASLTEKGIKIKSFDTKPVFEVFKNLLADDGVNATPTCVVEQDSKNEKATGKADIIKLLRSVK